jgi:hypothetical protein
MANEKGYSAEIPSDDLNQRIGVLARREVEARILAPIIEALGERFGREAAIEIVRDVVVGIAEQQGGELASAMGGSGSDEFMASLEFWTKDNALEIEVVAQSEETLEFDVKRCRYAEMYRDLGIPELGQVLSCNRDFALIDGFNGNAGLTRTQTIMEGAPHCDFRYRFPQRGEKHD